MHEKLKKFLKNRTIEASAPCRIDLGGTLDIRTFHYPLRHLHPCTVNMAVDLRTRVTLSPHEEGQVRIVSRGFPAAEYPLNEAPFDHALGLMFAVATYFQAHGVVIRIDSASPPRSALGGSSVAAVALIAALDAVIRETGGKGLGGRRIALLAHAVEETVAGVPCGFQDQLAAVYGGANVWHWPGGPDEPAFRKKTLLPRARHREMAERILIAYCGVPHESRNINGRWVGQFLSGRFRREWAEIVAWTKKFIDSIRDRNYKGAASAMLRETEIRRRMTPDVFDSVGEKLVESAARHGCGARFAGAGGGGCVWALGETEGIRRLQPVWREILAERETGGLLDAHIDAAGLSVIVSGKPSRGR
ncbi:MAG: galactokinase [Thermodesulfobacteriota bacterium]